MKEKADITASKAKGQSKKGAVSKGAATSAKGGRPQAELDSMGDGWKEAILTEYRVGASDTEVKALIHDMRGTFSNNLWERWMSERSEFWETIVYGRMLAEAWWLKQGRVNLQNREFNAFLYNGQMRNRYGWFLGNADEEDRTPITEKGYVLK